MEQKEGIGIKQYVMQDIGFDTYRMRESTGIDVYSQSQLERHVVGVSLNLNGLCEVHSERMSHGEV